MKVQLALLTAALGLIAAYLGGAESTRCDSQSVRTASAIGRFATVQSERGAMGPDAESNRPREGDARG